MEKLSQSKRLKALLFRKKKSVTIAILLSVFLICTASAGAISIGLIAYNSNNKETKDNSLSAEKSTLSVSNAVFYNYSSTQDLLLVTAKITNNKEESIMFKLSDFKLTGPKEKEYFSQNKSQELHMISSYSSAILSLPFIVEKDVFVSTLEINLPDYSLFADINPNSQHQINECYLNACANEETVVVDPETPDEPATTYEKEFAEALADLNSYIDGDVDLKPTTLDKLGITISLPKDAEAKYEETSTSYYDEYDGGAYPAYKDCYLFEADKTTISTTADYCKSYSIFYSFYSESKLVRIYDSFDLYIDMAPQTIVGSLSSTDKVETKKLTIGGTSVDMTTITDTQYSSTYSYFKWITPSGHTVLFYQTASSSTSAKAELAQLTEMIVETMK